MKLLTLAILALALSACTTMAPNPHSWSARNKVPLYNRVFQPLPYVAPDYAGTSINLH